MPLSSNKKRHASPFVNVAVYLMYTMVCLLPHPAPASRCRSAAFFNLCLGLFQSFHGRQEDPLPPTLHVAIFQSFCLLTSQHMGRLADDAPFLGGHIKVHVGKIMCALLDLPLVGFDLSVEFRIENLELGWMVVDLVVRQLMEQDRSCLSVRDQAIVCCRSHSNANSLAHILIQAEQVGMLVREQLREFPHLEAVLLANVDDGWIRAEPA